MLCVILYARRFFFLVCEGCPESTSVPCPNLVGGGGECLSGNCTEAKPGKDYCICPYGKTSRTCHVHKLGDCSLTTGRDLLCYSFLKFLLQ